LELTIEVIGFKGFPPRAHWRQAKGILRNKSVNNSQLTILSAKAAGEAKYDSIENSDTYVRVSILNTLKK